MGFLDQSATNRDFSRSDAGAFKPIPAAKRPTPRPLGSKIFISYRRSDTQHVAGRLFDHLKTAYTEKELFFDVDTIPMGDDFKQHISTAMRESAVILVVVGQHWVNRKWNSIWRWVPLLKTQEDFVLSEIELALDLGVPIIPLLVDNTAMPSMTQLPKTIVEFSSRNATRLGTGTDFHKDMAKVLDKVTELRNQALGKTPH